MSDRDEAMRRKHRDRAINAIALFICSTDLTDGFCSPRDGQCAHISSHLRGDCITRAKGCVQAMESRGVSPIWDFDPALKERL